MEERRGTLARISDAMGNIDKATVLGLIEKHLKNGLDPLKIIDELREGLEMVGDKFEKGEYFLLNLIYAAEVFKDAAALLMPKLQESQKGVKRRAKVLIGTVQGDIHDIGKNIVIALLDARGYEVTDLGVDVPPERFVDKIRELKPPVVGMSGLLTASIDSMNTTVKAIADGGFRRDVRVIIGGGIVGEEWTHGKVEADAVTRSAVEGVRLIEGFTTT